MRIRFHCLHKAQKYYEVVSGAAAIFCGTRGECRRFILLHNEKAMLSALKSTPRARTGPRRARRYRAAHSRAAGARITG